MLCHSGDVKLLKNRDTGKIRLLMRREKTLKICANHLVADDEKGTFKLKDHPSSDRSWTYTAQDFSEGETQLTTFAIRFANADSACPAPPAEAPAAALTVRLFTQTLTRSRRSTRSAKRKWRAAMRRLRRTTRVTTTTSKGRRAGGWRGPGDRSVREARRHGGETAALRSLGVGLEGGGPAGLGLLLHNGAREAGAEVGVWGAAGWASARLRWRRPVVSMELVWSKREETRHMPDH